jgi:hypothetical protein
VSDAETWVDSLWSAFERPWVQGQPPRPERLYHYGQAQGLLSILESQCLWATDARYLNDASELNYAIALVQETVDVLAAAPETQAVVRTFLAGLVPSLRDSSQPAVYTVSFCEEGDILSQWRAYAGITGYALGLATQWWDSIPDDGVRAERRPGPLRLRKVLYREEEQRRLLRSLLDPACTALAQASAQFGEALTFQAMEPQLRQRVTDDLRLLSPCLKHPAFTEEKEWRFILMPDAAKAAEGTVPAAVRFRAAAIGLVPYVPLPLPAVAGPFQGRLPVVEVYYGPCPHPDLAARALSSLLQAHGYAAPATQVRGSRAPLRV